MEVVKAFIDDLKKADAAVEAAKARRATAWANFEGDLDVIMNEAQKKVAALTKKHGLTFRKGHVLGCVRAKDGGYYSEYLDEDSFEQTSKRGNAQSVADGGVKSVTDMIARASAKALYEIEIHGKKDTLDQIVADAIDGIRKGE